MRAAVWLIAVVIVIIFWNRLVPEDLLATIKAYTSNPFPIFLVFFISETIIGILPPELFIGWALSHEEIPFAVNVLFLSMVSYLAGILAYGMGRWIRNFSYVRIRLRAKKVRNYVQYYERWGGLLIIISAVTPVPFATISLISGTFSFGIWRYLLYSSVRFARFAMVAYIIFRASAL
ncbi:MAG: hypothetical protein KDD36_00825 [Flavobacteriales bacterium]|nr:hypothetical protein [Flavobacteriales bacterium]